ncbi:MAG: molecular chaperone DnaJ, partial [Nitrospinota bacterium]
DQLVEVVVKTPTDLSEEQKALLREFERLEQEKHSRPFSHRKSFWRRK